MFKGEMYDPPYFLDREAIRTVLILAFLAAWTIGSIAIFATSSSNPRPSNTGPTGTKPSEPTPAGLVNDLLRAVGEAQK